MARRPGVLDETPPERKAERDPLDPFGRSLSGTSLGDLGPRIEQDLAEERDDEYRRRLLQESGTFRIIQHNIPHVGRVVVPHFNSYVAYRHLYDSHLYDIGFSPSFYEAFDAVVAKAYGKDAFVNFKNYHYESYEPLRRNIAIVRSFIYANYFPDGQFNMTDAQDQRNADMLPEIAKTLGTAMKHSWMAKVPLIGGLLARAFNVIDVDLASIPDDGGATIYKHLLSMQNRPSLMNPMSWFGKAPGKSWNLPPIEKSIFSNVHSRISELDIDPWQPDVQKSPAGEMLNTAFHLDQVALNLRTPQDLEPPVLDRSIELAREILDKFRIIGGSNRENDSLALDSADETVQASRLQDLALIYQDYISSIAHTNPELLNSPVFENARMALRRLSYHLKLQALSELKDSGDADAVQLVTEILGEAKPQWRAMPAADFQDLASQLEAGLEEAARIKGQPPRHETAARAHAPAADKSLAAAKTQLADKPPPDSTKARSQAMKQAAKTGKDMQHTMVTTRVSKASNKTAVDMALKANQRATIKAPKITPDDPDIERKKRSDSIKL